MKLAAGRCACVGVRGTFLKHRGGSALRGLLCCALIGISVVYRSVAADCFTNHPFQGVVYYRETRPEPPTRLLIAEVELTNANVRVRVAPGGPDPDGAGRWETTLMAPTRIAARERFDLVVNGDFFDALNIKDAEGTNSTYRPDVWAAVNGPAVTDGRVWSTSSNTLPCLVVHKDQRLSIEMLQHPTGDDWEVVAGNTMLVADGAIVPHQSKTRHPRTAVGLSANGSRLILLVVDGRKPGVAVGMSYDELATEMLRWGCRDALNLDGGGSSVMAIRDAATGDFKILNEPSDGRERPVANVLGISVSQRPE